MVDTFSFDETQDEQQPKFVGFYYLMLNKIQDILVVSNPYDAFILEEDRSLSEQLSSDYFDLSLSAAPRVVHASSGKEALRLLKNHNYGLVITMTRIGDMDPFSLGEEIKNIRPDLPVVLLGYDTAEVAFFMEMKDRRPGIDNIFVWTGDSGILMAIVKYMEDTLNVEDDTRQGMVRVIILVEDSPRYYSKFLPLLYQEIMVQTRDLVYDSLSEREKKLRRRARPKVLLATNFEEALEYYNKYHDNVLAVITDVRYPVSGEVDAKAGFRLVKIVKEDDITTPCLVQSSECENSRQANKMGARFIYKDSDTFAQKLRNFIRTDMGFGDFVFRTPSGTEVERARNITEMGQKLLTVSEESLTFHAENDHFSNWFMARSEFKLASVLKPFKIRDFSTITNMRKHLITTISECIEERKHGVIINYADSGFSQDSSFVRYGEGSIGGKARGIAFMDALLIRNKLHKKYPNIRTRIPQTFVISTDVFDEFMNSNNLIEFALEEKSDQKIIDTFLQGEFPRIFISALQNSLRFYQCPIAVRSSSLLEDAFYQPLAGIYSTYMLPNNHPDIEYRLEQLIISIKTIYASTYLQNSKSYHAATTNRLKEEKMAIVIQELAGRNYGDYYYPCISGVAQSYNFYPMEPMQPADGIAMAALGLGKIVVGGGRVVRFCPKHPEVNPCSSSARDITNKSQSEFYALNMKEQACIKVDETDNLTLLPLSVAEKDGTLFPVGSVYVAQDGMIRDSLQYAGPRVVTFANILKYDLFPLNDIINEFLRIGSLGMGSPVEIEFAVNIDEDESKGIDFYFLQIRPMVTHQEEMAISFDNIEEEHILCSTEQSLGNGLISDIEDIILVNPDYFELALTRSIATEVGYFNDKMLKEGRKYLLIGPGRWGSSDPWLGIPVNWSQISGVGVIVETKLDKLNVDPSQGTHFFHNIVSLGVGYLTVMTDSIGEFLNWPLLQKLTPTEEKRFLTHYRLDHPLDVRIHGKTGKAMIMIDED